MAGHHIKRGVSEVLQPIKKLTRISVLNAKETILKKINILCIVSFLSG